MANETTEQKETASPGGSRLEAVVSWPDWIPVTEQMPRRFEPVLLLFETGARRIGQYTESVGFHSYGYSQDWTLTPTHWLPLPPDKAS